jgi:hypothetical protein
VGEDEIFELAALDATDAAELAFELTFELAPELTIELALELTALDTTEAVELELTLDADDAGTLDADEVVAAEDGGTEGEGLLLFPPPPQATRLHKVMLHAIARALWRRRNLLDGCIDDSELL